MESSDALEIQVANFGPIVEANVDLRPFTLFVGPSNTGKSYLAIMIYSLHRLFGGMGARRVSWRRGAYGRYPPHVWKNPRRDPSLCSDSEVKDLLDWALDMSTQGEQRRGARRFRNALPETVASLVRSLICANDVSDEVTQAEIIRCFGLQSAEQLVRRPGATGAQIVLRRCVEARGEGESPFVHQLDISRQGATRLSTDVPKEKALYYGNDIDRMLWRVQRPLPDEDKKVFASMLIENLVDGVLPYIVGPASLPAHYLPADRAGVMHAHRVVVGALVERATSAGIRPASPVPMLSGVLADFLEQLIALGDRPLGRPRRKTDLAARLEETLLVGTVQHEGKTKPEGPYSSFSYRPHGWKESLPMMRTSSMVSELVPVVLYLRYVVERGDVLIIEEPESHLHPEMQVEFTRFLASVVRSGVRIIMTTHSEWVLEELANLVQASELSESERIAINGSDIALDESDVGAWLFQPKKRPKGSVVEEIPLNRESGTFAAGYDKVAVDGYNRWAEMTSRTDKREGNE